MKSVIVLGLVGGFFHQVFCSFPYLVAPRSSDVSKQCKIHSEAYVRSLSNLTQWAAKMYDSSAKLPHGIIVGNNYQFGNFDECINTHVDLGPKHGGKIDGQYCLVRFQLGTDEPFNPIRTELETDPFESVWDKIRPSGDLATWKKNYLYYGTCVPASCTPNDVLITVKDMLKQHYLIGSITATQNPAECQTRATINKYKKSTSMDLLIKLVFAGFTSLVIYSTAYDFIFYKTKNATKTGGSTERLLMSFSARTNLPDAIMPAKTTEEFGAIFGCRTVFTIIILWGHRWRMMAQAPHHDATPFEQLAREFTGLTTGLINVNSFLALTGFVTAYCFYPELEKREEKKKLSPFIILHAVVYRVLRFTPLYAAVLLLNIFILPKLNDGPLWPALVGREVSNCMKTWWTNILYINNYVDANHMCMFQTWYLSTDLQLFILTLIVLYITKKSVKLGYFLFAILIIGSIIWHGVQLYVRNDIFILPVDEQTMRAIPDSYYYVTYHVPAHFRLGPFLISALIGYLSCKWKETPSKMSLAQMNILGIFVMVLTILVKETANFFVLLKYGLRQNKLASALYGSLHSTLWAAGISCIMLLGFRKTDFFIFKVFNWYPFVMVQKLVYCIYLIHPSVHLYEFGSLRVPKVSSIFEEYWLTAGDVFFTCLLAVVLCVLVEMPSSKIVKILFHTGRPKLKEQEKNTEVQVHEQVNGEIINTSINGGVKNGVIVTDVKNGSTIPLNHQLNDVKTL